MDRNPQAVELGKKLKEARIKRGWSQSKAAKHIGISKSYLAHLEQGVNDLSKAPIPMRVRIEEKLRWDTKEQ